MSESFQKDDVLLVEVTELVTAAVFRLESLKTIPEKHMKLFMELFNPGEKKIGEIDLTGPVPAKQELDYTKDKELHQFIDGTVEYLKQTFDVFEQEPLSLFQIFDFQKWPFDMESLSTFGNENIKKLTDGILAEYLTEDERESITGEWAFLKSYLYRFRKEPLVNTYTMLLQLKPEKMKNTLSVLEFMLCISPCTAACERGFSMMGTVKTNLRSQMSQQSLHDQRTIMCNGPELANFNPDPVIDRWYLSGPGTRHIAAGHKPPTSKDAYGSWPVMTDEDILNVSI